MGVFATRSPFRPNPIGLSSVRLQRVELSDRLGPVLHVRGRPGRRHPIYDIKPYLPYTDAHPEAAGGFAPAERDGPWRWIFPGAARARPRGAAPGLTAVLAQDPRPGYQDEPGRVYGMAFGPVNVRFHRGGRPADGVPGERDTQPLLSKRRRRACGRVAFCVPKKSAALPKARPPVP